MQDSLEEASTSYGLIAEWASYPPDFSSVTFKLRDEAHWHDGSRSRLRTSSIASR